MQLDGVTKLDWNCISLGVESVWKFSRRKFSVLKCWQSKVMNACKVEPGRSLRTQPLNYQLQLLPHRHRLAHHLRTYHRDRDVRFVEEALLGHPTPQRKNNRILIKLNHTQFRFKYQNTKILFRIPEKLVKAHVKLSSVMWHDLIQTSCFQTLDGSTMGCISVCSDGHSIVKAPGLRDVIVQVWKFQTHPESAESAQ